MLIYRRTIRIEKESIMAEFLLMASWKKGPGELMNRRIFHTHWDVHKTSFGTTGTY